jgi:hypothetical protein
MGNNGSIRLKSNIKTAKKRWLTLIIRINKQSLHQNQQNIF